MGKPWMTKLEGTWPCKKSFSPAQEEEFRKDMLEGACNVVKGTPSRCQNEKVISHWPEREDWTGW
jgi:hypothetical protein